MSQLACSATSGVACVAVNIFIQLAQPNMFIMVRKSVKKVLNELVKYCTCFKDYGCQLIASTANGGFERSL